jgi:hypothetical protein
MQSLAILSAIHEVLLRLRPRCHSDSTGNGITSVAYQLGVLLQPNSTLWGASST